MERAQYETDYAQRQYDAADPENRLVTRALEARWNAKLEAQQHLHAEYVAAQADRASGPSAADRGFLEQLPETFATLWTNASTTDRKRLLRCLLEDVTLTAPRDSRTIEIGVRWRSQRTDTCAVARALPAAERRRHSVDTVDQIRVWAQTLSDDAMVEAFHAAQRCTPDGRPFTRDAIRWIRWKHHIPACPWAPPPDTCTVQACAQRFQVSPGVVYTWIAQGVIPAIQFGPGHRWALTLDAAIAARCQQWIAQSSRLSGRGDPSRDAEIPRH